MVLSNISKFTHGVVLIVAISLTLGISVNSRAKENQSAFMLGVNSLDSTVSIYTLDAQGHLRQVKFYPAAKNPKAVAVHPNGKFAYVVSKTANVVVAYEIVQANNQFELQNPKAYEIPAASPFALTIDPSGRFLYIAARAGKIAAYIINARNGALTAVPHSPFASQYRTRSLLVHPSGRFLFAINAYANSISAYRIDQTSGQLTPLNGSPFPAGDPKQPLRSLWPLADVPQGAGGIPYFVTQDPQGRFLYISQWGAGKITGFAVDNTSGILKQLPGSPFDTALNPYVVAVHPSGDYLYVGSWESNSLLAYRINKQNGSLIPLPKKSFPINGKSPVSLVFSADGTNAFVANSESANISTFHVNQQSGELSMLQTTQTRPGPWWLSSPLAMTTPHFNKHIFTLDKRRNKLYAWDITENQQVQLLASTSLPAIDAWMVQESLGVAYITDAIKKEIHAYSLDTVTHKFAEVPQSPWPLPGKPLSIQIDLNGWYLYVTTSTPAALLAFGIAPKNGSLIPVQQPVSLQKASPMDLILDPVSRFAYGFSSTSLRWFSYRQNIGPLLFQRSRFGSPFSLRYSPAAGVFDPGANFLMLSHRRDTVISVYEVQPVSGTPTEVNGSPFHIKHAISTMMVSASGASLYVYDHNMAKLHAYHRNVVSGRIGHEYSLPQELADGQITAVCLQGEYLYSADAATGHLLIYHTDSRTDALYLAARIQLPANVDEIKTN